MDYDEILKQRIALLQVGDIIKSYDLYHNVNSRDLTIIDLNKDNVITTLVNPYLFTKYTINKKYIKLTDDKTELCCFYNKLKLIDYNESLYELSYESRNT